MACQSLLPSIPKQLLSSHPHLSNASEPRSSDALEVDGIRGKAKNLTDMFLSFPLIPSTSNASEDLGSNSKMHHHFLWFSPSPLLFHGISLDHLLYTNWNILLTLCYYCLPPIHSPRIGQSNHFKMQSTFIFSLLKSL